MRLNFIYTLFNTRLLKFFNTYYRKLSAKKILWFIKKKYTRTIYCFYMRLQKKKFFFSSDLLRKIIYATY